MIDLIKITLCGSSFHDVGWTRDEINQKAPSSTIQITQNPHPCMLVGFLPLLLLWMTHKGKKKNEEIFTKVTN
jgi:hypothetical protein